jgi:hypothetical protein
MCNKHIPIIIYDCGGTRQVCSECGKPLSDWKENGIPKKHPKEKIKEKNEQSITT